MEYIGVAKNHRLGVMVFKFQADNALTAWARLQKIMKFELPQIEGEKWEMVSYNCSQYVSNY